MALFDRFKKKQTAQPAKKAEALQSAKKSSAASPSAKAPGGSPVGAQRVAPKQESIKKAEKKSSEKEVTIVDTKAGSYAGLLVKPHVSEKASVLADRGIYVFDVPVSANKVEVRKAVEAIYKVNVVKVRTERGIGKVVRRGRLTGRRNAWKKALVELKKGQTITLVEGV